MNFHKKSQEGAFPISRMKSKSLLGLNLFATFVYSRHLVATSGVAAFMAVTMMPIAISGMKDI
ncbi:uncharacterized protein Dmul_03680 [Desulfococcus multivorans]|nr:uncharacterized protein Dmul_03680 [Desulfococcus multivorans]